MPRKEEGWDLGYLAEYSSASWGSCAKEHYRGRQNSSRAELARPPRGKLQLGPPTQRSAREARFASESSSAFGSAQSVLAPGFTRTRPALDRLAACKTNAPLNDGSSATRTSSMQEAFKKPPRGSATAVRRAKHNFDCLPPADPPGRRFNIVTGRFDQAFPAAR